jgi:hypothetical protein
MDLHHPGPGAIRRLRFCCSRGLGLLKEEIPLNRIVGPTNQNMWVPHEYLMNPRGSRMWAPPKHIVGPA